MRILGIAASAYSAPKPVVTGGTLTSDATYYYRTFTANGNLTVSNASLDVDLVVVGGGTGGGGGNDNWSAGNASSIGSLLTAQGGSGSSYQQGGSYQASRTPTNGVSALGTVYAGGGGSGATPLGGNTTPQAGGTGGGGEGGDTSSSREGKNGTTGGGGGGVGSVNSGAYGGNGGSGGQVQTTSASAILGTYAVTIGGGSAGIAASAGQGGLVSGGNGGSGIVVVRYTKAQVD